MGRLKVNFRAQSHSTCAVSFQTIKKCLLNSPLREHWNPKVPSPDTFAEVADRYSAAFDAARNGDRVYIALRNNIRDEAAAMLEKIAAYIEVELADNPTDLLTLGFDVKKERGAKNKVPLTPPVNFKVTNDARRGVVIGSASRVTGAASYEAHVAEGDPSAEENWRHLCVFARASNMVIDDLEAGKNYFFRLRAIGEDGPGPWSNPVNTIVT